MLLQTMPSVQYISHSEVSTDSYKHMYLFLTFTEMWSKASKLNYELSLPAKADLFTHIHIYHISTASVITMIFGHAHYNYNCYR